MAEGLFDAVLAGEEEKSIPTEGGTEPFVCAVVANVGKQSPAATKKELKEAHALNPAARQGRAHDQARLKHYPRLLNKGNKT